jgi:hypothetical protein
MGALVGCSSGDDDGFGFAFGTTTGGTGNTPLGNGGLGIGATTGAGTGAPGSFDGGEIPLTQDQVTAIKHQACVGVAVEGESVPSVLQLVIDVSSSMNDRAPGSMDSKWVATRDALLEAIPGDGGSRPGLGASVAVGLLFYPNEVASVSERQQDVSACVNVDAMVPPARLGDAHGAQRALVRDALEQVQLQVSTPTHDAYRYAFEKGITPTNLPGQKFMLLITDGTPTLSLGCSNPSGHVSDVDPEPIVQEVTRVAKAGIRTFLIGSPGSEANRNWLSRAAQIGGTAPAGCSPDGPHYCHLDMTTAPDFSAALRAGLSSIAGQIAPCTYSFPDPPDGRAIDPNEITVILGSGGQSQLIVRDDIGDCSQGWQLTSQNEILLCPDTCAEAQEDPKTSLDVVFGCESPTEIPK